MAKESTKDYKFGVEDLADKLGIEPASVRIKLRNAGIKKLNGNSYGWETKSDLDEVVSKLKDVKASPTKKSDGKSEKKAPAKKAPAKGKSDAKGKADTKSAPKKKAA